MPQKTKPKSRVGTTLVGPRLGFNKSIVAIVIGAVISVGGYLAVHRSLACTGYYCSGSGYAGSAVTSSPRGFLNQWDGRCLDFNNQQTWNGGRVQQWDCNNGPWQRWYVRIVDNANGWFTLANQYDAKCLDFNNQQPWNGGLVQQWDCNGGPWQQFRFIYSDGTWAALQNRWDGRCVDFNNQQPWNGGKVQQWDCNNGPWQRWRL